MLSEILTGGLAASLACVVTNPMEVVKNRLQVQGELQAKGEYRTVYRGGIQGLRVILRTDGVRSLQAGLGPAMVYQLVMNGLRLGTYAHMEKCGWTRDGGQSSVGRVLGCSILAGCIGGFIGSPFFLVKTHLQISSSPSIRVGHQHQHSSMAAAFTNIYRAGGARGLMQGVSASVPRISLGSAAQLVTYSHTMDLLSKTNCSTWQNNVLAAFISGFSVAFVINPVDVIATRLYNQSASNPLYHGYWDCVGKVARKEGVMAFYKGVTAQYLRIGPHSLLQLIFWHHGRKVLENWQ